MTSQPRPLRRRMAGLPESRLLPPRAAFCGGALRALLPTTWQRDLAARARDQRREVVDELVASEADEFLVTPLATVRSMPSTIRDRSRPSMPIDSMPFRRSSETSPIRMVSES